MRGIIILVLVSVAYFCVTTSIWGYFGKSEIEKKNHLVWAGIWWTITLPFILAWGLGRYIRLNVDNWYDQT